MELLVNQRRLFGPIDDERRAKAHSMDAPYEPAEQAFREAMRRHRRDEPAVERALEFAKSLEFKSSSLGKSYLAHPLRVATFLLELSPAIGTDYLVIALLHNALETAQIAPSALEERFGAVVARGIETLTVDRSRPFETLEEAYYARLFAAGPDLALVKLFDKADNLFVLCLNPDAEVRRRYLDEIDRRLIPFARTVHAGLASYLEALTSDCRRTGHKTKREIS
jgi:(p)ppGpp synthase/HD superfamily hydrolase